ncbi:MAG: helix-turn-helix domain-containing protein [Deltaproteobacteria bacterium]|jgi:DNA-binding transcriptional MerR regulator|nr:helix-turn-helix domain-containing protein [Deltaproteobacteria bacterium]
MAQVNRRKTYTVAELESITAFSRRTIRHYVNVGLVSRPMGEGRGSYYTAAHLRELLDIRSLTDEGLTLEAAGARIRQERMRGMASTARKPGVIQVQSRVCLAPGVDLVVSPEESAFSAEEIREIARSCVSAARKISKRKAAAPAKAPSAVTGPGSLLSLQFPFAGGRGEPPVFMDLEPLPPGARKPRREETGTPGQGGKS